MPNLLFTFCLQSGNSRRARTLLFFFTAESSVPGTWLGLIDVSRMSNGWPFQRASCKLVCSSRIWMAKTRPSGISGQKQTQSEVLSRLRILFSDLLPRWIPGKKLASAKCIRESKLGSVAELLSTILDKEMLTSETPKEAAGQEDSWPCSSQERKEEIGAIDPESHRDLVLRSSASKLRERWWAEWFCYADVRKEGPGCLQLVPLPQVWFFLDHIMVYMSADCLGWYKFICTVIYIINVDTELSL